MSSLSSKAHQKSGSFPPPALPSFVGRTTLSDSRSVRRQMRRWSCELQPKRASPDYPSHPSSVPCHIPRRTERVRRLLPRSRGLPRYSGGSASASSLSRPAQALLALRPAGLLNRPRRPLSRGFNPVGRPTSCSSATRSIDNSLGGTFLHWCYAPSGRTEKVGLVLAEPYSGLVTCCR